MRPLHRGLFELLSTIKQDGTFNQLAPVRRLLRAGYTRFWSYDLSAATDRLPISIQVELLRPVLEEVDSWARLMVDRDYAYSAPKKLGGAVGIVRYAVGQPMGALSSWAMLAVTHHFLVQLAAKRAGLIRDGQWFQGYAVLGDDIVIAEGRVAREYLAIMRGLGVEIGLAKSLISNRRSLEFAKRFFWHGIDCSPISLRELIAAQLNLSAMRLLRDKLSLRVASVLDLKGYGYRMKGAMERRFEGLRRRLVVLLVEMAYSPDRVKS